MSRLDFSHIATPHTFYLAHHIKLPISCQEMRFGCPISPCPFDRASHPCRHPFSSSRPSSQGENVTETMQKSKMKTSPSSSGLLVARLRRAACQAEREGACHPRVDLLCHCRRDPSPRSSQRGSASGRTRRTTGGDCDGACPPFRSVRQGATPTRTSSRRPHPAWARRHCGSRHCGSRHCLRPSHGHRRTPPRRRFRPSPWRDAVSRHGASVGGTGTNLSLRRRTLTSTIWSVGRRHRLSSRPSRACCPRSSSDDNDCPTKRSCRTRTMSTRTSSWTTWSCRCCCGFRSCSCPMSSSRRPSSRRRRRPSARPASPPQPAPAPV